MYECAGDRDDASEIVLRFTCLSGKSIAIVLFCSRVIPGSAAQFNFIKTLTYRNMHAALSYPEISARRRTTFTAVGLPLLKQRERRQMS